ncbi:MAG TPA: peptide chain release factor N(5)-glutamine methyltransferase [Candidatus Binatia bacterium]|nr:peptide chain release factor N(5)-glutamine methyltransferase [Candidatus Binatia bacterium]
MKVFEALALAQRRVPVADAEFLLAHVLGVTRGELQASRDDFVEWTDQEDFTALLERRVRGEPVAYLVGAWEFWSLPLKTTRDVLVPRPETELLVEWALEIVGAAHGRDSAGPALPKASRPWAAPTILDLGTGSGCIALALAKELPKAAITAVDASEAALAIARANGDLKLARVEFLHGSWYEPVAGRHFDLVVSNPPYVAERDPHLIELRHEPREALVGGWDGLAALSHIIAGAREHLSTDGWLLLEHGFTQGEAVRGLLADAGFVEVTTRKDLEGRERASGGRMPA